MTWRSASTLSASALLALAAAAPARAERTRVFAVAPRVDMSWLDTREHYHDKLLALADKRVRAGGRVEVQRGADDVASHLVGGGHDLVVLPEDLGLMSAFTGTRGAPARGSSSLIEAIVTLAGSYGPVNAYYTAHYPELAQRPVRLLAVSLTDTFARAAVETAAELARRLRAYVAIGATMAQDWRIVCADKATFTPPPGATGCDEQDPAKVAMLRSPDEPQRDYAYEATTPKPSNMALVFDPDGRLIAKEIKTYLTPDELPGAGLDLVPGPVSGLGVVDTRAGRLGFVTSKDAWMPDVLDRLDEARVDVLVQPEFFANDTIRTTGMWAADTLKASGYSALLREPSFGAWVVANMTGNLFDYDSDAQSAIAVKPRSAAAPRGRLIGQGAVPGFVAVSPWVVPDPLSLPIVQRRQALGAAGEALLPNGGGPACPAPDVAGPCRGGQVEGVVWHDVALARAPRLRAPRLQRRGRAPFGINRPLARSRSPQRNVALAARGERAWAAFEQGDGLRLARSGDGGRHWTRARSLGGGEWPSLAAGPRGELWLAYQRSRRVHVAHSTDGGRRWRRFAIDGEDPQWKPSIAARGPGRAYVAWVDERGRFAEDDLPRADVYGAGVTAAGPGAPVKLDTAPTTSDLAAKLDNDWAPSVAAGAGRVVVAWVDFRAYKWDVLERESRDGGASFGAVRQVNDSAPDLESLDDTPRAAVDGSVAWTDFRKTRDILPHPLDSIYAGANGQIDGHGADQVVSAAPARAGDLVAWQDHARGLGEILVRRLGAAKVFHVTDRGARGNAWRPSLALAGRRVLVAWEDERDGPPQVYVASASPRGNLALSPGR